MFTRMNRGFDQSRAMFRMQCRIDDFDVIPLEDFMETFTNLGAGIKLFAPCLGACAIYIADNGYFQAKLLIRPKVVFGHAAGAHQADLRPIVSRLWRQIGKFRSRDSRRTYLLA